ncbi:hypothetical protein GF327_06695 [Candidatus Woesearchaeota archaeon]|nr:hypothetical protein [Candidatus Woesearchaeota archaeon]
MAARFDIIEVIFNVLLVFILPGLGLNLIVFRRQNYLERLIIAIGFSFVMDLVLALCFTFLSIPIMKESIFLGLIFLSLVFFVIFLFNNLLNRK